ncbi:MAG: UDP-3-O-acyl-N-acetylglucosamine deacetylase, partial [Bacteroidales bacterium]|nr:UDP-3-O-acyl-N-acetylglucosamine deacetylase [Bacteroidales bacterium]
MVTSNQKTLHHKHEFQGKGLHTGKISRMVLLPAPASTGIVFRRVDLEGSPSVKAVAENVSSTARSTTISDGVASVSTIEHLMSAFA